MHRPGPTHYVMLAYHAPEASHADAAPLVVLSSILGGASSPIAWGGARGLGRSSRLYRALIDGEIATSVSAGYELTLDPYLFAIDATLREGVEPARAEAAILVTKSSASNARACPHGRAGAHQAPAACAGGVFARRRHQSGLRARLHGPGRARSGRLGDVPRSAPERHRPTTSSAWRSTYLVEQPAHDRLVRARQRGQLRQTALMASQRRAAPCDPSACRSTTAWCCSHNRAAANPSVVVRALVRAGASRETPGEYGIASLTGRMLRQGTQNIAKVSPRRRARRHGRGPVRGRRLRAGRRSRSSASAAIFRERWRSWPSWLRRPTFPADELERLRGPGADRSQRDGRQHARHVRAHLARAGLSRPAIRTIA